MHAVIQEAPNKSLPQYLEIVLTKTVYVRDIYIELCFTYEFANTGKRKQKTILGAAYDALKNSHLNIRALSYLSPVLPENLLERNKKITYMTVKCRLKEKLLFKNKTIKNVLYL